MVRRGRGYLNGVVEGNDVGVADAAEDVDLGEDAVAELAAEPQPLHGDLLHGHLRAPCAVPPQPHLRVGPRPDRPHQHVLPHPPPAPAPAVAVLHRPVRLLRAPSRCSRGRSVPGEKRCRRPRGEATVLLRGTERERGEEEKGNQVFTRGVWLSLSAALIRFLRLLQDSPYYWNMTYPFILATRANIVLHHNVFSE